MSIIKMNY